MFRGQKAAAQLGYVPLPAVVVKHNQDTLKSLTFIGTPLHTGHLPRSKKRITYVSKIGEQTQQEVHKVSVKNLIIIDIVRLQVIKVMLFLPDYNVSVLE